LLIEKAEELCPVKYKLLALILGENGERRDRQSFGPW
jgi:hypothetical protein